MTREQTQLVSGVLVNWILDRLLALSVWKTAHPQAYKDLLELRDDMKEDLADVLRRLEIK